MLYVKATAVISINQPRMPLRRARTSRLANQFLRIVSTILFILYSTFIIGLGSYERKGNLFKKSLNHPKFKKRQFVLLGDQLFYYKTGQ